MPFGSLWLPVTVSAVVVFVASSVLHMVLKYHKADYKPVPNDAAVVAALAQGNPGPGVYFTPHCADMKMMKDPAMVKRFETGPVAMITLMPKGLPQMGKHLGLWFGFCFLTSFAAGSMARHVLTPGADGLAIMWTTGTVAFASYALSQLVDSIWKAQPWANTLRFVLDGLIYTILTALTFRLLWPAA